MQKIISSTKKESKKIKIIKTKEKKGLRKKI